MERKLGTFTVIYGSPGVGKTTWAAAEGQALGRTLYLDLEGGVRFLEGNQAVNRVRVNKFEGVMGILNHSNVEQYQMVVVDTVDRLEQLSRRALEREEGSNPRITLAKSHGGFGNGLRIWRNQFEDFVSKCSDLTEAGINVICVCHGKYTESLDILTRESITRYSLALDAVNSAFITAACDEIFMFAIQGREWLGHPCALGDFVAKNRRGLTAPFSLNTPLSHQLQTATAQQQGTETKEKTT